MAHSKPHFRSILSLRFGPSRRWLRTEPTLFDDVASHIKCATLFVHVSALAPQCLTVVTGIAKYNVVQFTHHPSQRQRPSNGLPGCCLVPLIGETCCDCFGVRHKRCGSCDTSQDRCHFSYLLVWWCLVVLLVVCGWAFLRDGGSFLFCGLGFNILLLRNQQSHCECGCFADVTASDAATLISSVLVR